MSEADLELVRHAFEVFGPDMFDTGILAEDHEFRPTVTRSDLVERPLFVGREGFAEFVREAERAWSSLVLELIELHDLGDGIVLSEYRLNVVGRESGVPVSTPTAGLYVVRDGQIVVTNVYPALEEARDAATEMRTAVTRELLEAFNRGDVEGYLAGCHPDCVWYPLLADIEGPRRGHAGIRAWLEETAQTVEDFRIELRDVRFTDHRGLLVGSLRGRGRGSGVPFEREVAIVMELRGLRMYRARAYPSKADALAASAPIT